MVLVLLAWAVPGCDTAADDDRVCDDDDPDVSDQADDDSAAGDDDSAGADDDDAVDCSEPVPAPCDRIWPTTGELYYQQLGFGGLSLGGATHGELVNAGGGSIVIATMDRGDTYAVQAIGANGAVLESRAFHSVRRCR